MVREILLLGNEALYQISAPVTDCEDVSAVIADLHDTLMNFRQTHGFGRAIAAPQIGVHKRIIYLYLDRPTVFINPTLEFLDGETMEVLDDCMSFPGLCVKVRRYRRCRVRYLDALRQPQTLLLEGDLSELLQHEYDHLDGILATMRAVDEKAFVLTSRP